jgi:transmembrane sensor
MGNGVNEEASSGADVDRCAAEWVARLDGRPLDAAERDAFRNWLDAHPDHRAAFDEAHTAWRSLDMLRRDPGAWQARPAPARKKPLGRRGIGAVASLLVLALLGLRYQIGDPWIAFAADYRTNPGERREVRLSDGSVVELGSASAIALHFSADERRVSLLAGEAFFHAAPRDGAERRAFMVEAAHGTTTALGTQFMVEEGDGAANVTAVKHRIQVGLSVPARGRESVVLSPGDTVRYDRANGLGGVRQIDVDEATAWRRGMLVFDSVPLGEVVRKLNRYRRGRIVIVDQALAQRRVSGVFATDDLNDVIRTITAELGVRASSIPPLVTLIY